MEDRETGLMDVVWMEKKEQGYPDQRGYIYNPRWE